LHPSLNKCHIDNLYTHAAIQVQDFSYSMMYLICSVGGKLSQNWIFAGDTAQMVSPGCSFKFAGLKEVLLAISPGIESKLKKVSHLLKNYRTTKNILDVGNAILTKAKKYYPGAIEYAKKEQAMNDNGLKVVLVDWDSVVDQTSPVFGRDQALIYSFSISSEKNNKHSLRQWLGNHPFILNVIESKGLEFDGKKWNVLVFVIYTHESPI
jgi:ATP-dependent exoDNAse (exonuclease V) beta subunit (contains helicase and exonuclease domains)